MIDDDSIVWICFAIVLCAFLITIIGGIELGELPDKNSTVTDTEVTLSEKGDFIFINARVTGEVNHIDDSIFWKRVESYWVRVVDEDKGNVTSWKQTRKQYNLTEGDKFSVSANWSFNPDNSSVNTDDYIVLFRDTPTADVYYLNKNGTNKKWMNSEDNR